MIFGKKKHDKVGSRLKMDREILLDLKREMNCLHLIVMRLHLSGIQLDQLTIDKQEYLDSRESLLAVRLLVRVKNCNRFNEALKTLADLDGVVRIYAVDEAM